MIELWLAGVYVLGSIAGFIIGNNWGHRRGQTLLMSTLILDGYVKSKKNKDGNLVLIKVNENQL
jgi:hypothetical protein